MSDIHPLLQQAQTFLAQENFEKVIELTTDVLEANNTEKPKFGMRPDGERVLALQLRCSAYFGSHFYADVLSDAEMLIRLLPNGFPGYYYRGGALLHFDEVEDAKSDFNHLLKFPLPPALQTGVYHSLGLAEYIAGNYEASLRHYNRAIELSPSEETTGSIYSNIAIVYFRQNDMTAAWNAYKTAQHLNPAHDHTQMGMAVLHAAEGRWEEALTIWRSLASQRPFFKDVEEVVERYYHWTPPMGDIVRQIAARANA